MRANEVPLDTEKLLDGLGCVSGLQHLVIRQSQPWHLVRKEDRTQWVEYDKKKVVEVSAAVRGSIQVEFVAG